MPLAAGVGLSAGMKNDIFGMGNVGRPTSGEVHLGAADEALLLVRWQTRVVIVCGSRPREMSAGRHVRSTLPGEAE